MSISIPYDISQQAPEADGWMEVILRAAHDLEESLATPAGAGDLAAQLKAMASGAAMITGASPLGHQLAGLVAGRSGVPLALWAENGARGTVLIVEGVLASGVQLPRTARRALAAGADRIVGVAVIAEPNGLAACRREVGNEVRALRELSLAS